MVRPQVSPKFSRPQSPVPPATFRPSSGLGSSGQGAVEAPGSSVSEPQAGPNAKPPAKILFQKFFKSVGTRTYAAQVKEFSNGNHAMVLIEGKRDKESGEVKKHSLYLFSEDFAAFMDMVDEVRAFIQEHPVPAEVRERQKAYWSKDGKPKFRAKRSAATA